MRAGWALVELRADPIEVRGRGLATVATTLGKLSLYVRYLVFFLFSEMRWQWWHAPINPQKNLAVSLPPPVARPGNIASMTRPRCLFSQSHATSPPIVLANSARATGNVGRE